ncbi:hypothetical protein [Caballeronia sp. LZ034LL]|uniref:hypothetical protein n=1 Tax=Caballeronia sp. LZ034LL TaxID=3038567 RepID=UPI0028553AAE|nr:hypothetical protein [Caballeronia sp. LZ034LL]MDR5839298.1 hypothetical protein [Caballeronia sp. LZ034LL]
MNKELVTIVALSVDTRHAVLYKLDGSTITIPQGDARLPRILAESKEFLEENMPALVDVSPIVPVRTEFGAAEQGTKGMVKFFRVAKSFLKKLVNTESPEEVPAEVAHISPLDIGVFPGRDVVNQGTKEGSEAPQKAVPDMSAPLSQEEAEDKQVRLGQDATTRQSPTPLTNDQKLDAAQARLQQLVGNSVGTADASFHTPLSQDETIVAVHEKTGAIIPDAHKLARQLRSSQKLQNYTGFERFIERLAAIIDDRGHSVEDLMKFIEQGDLPIADDGSIVIYKRLNRVQDGVFVDVHTGRIRQKVGSYVFMRAGLVDPNRRKDCSNGLHVAALSYLGGFSGNVTVIAKVRPEDVFAVPEYSHNKMRVSGYHILGELPEALRNLVNGGGSISSNAEGARLLNDVLRGNHIGILEHVEIGGDQGTNVTYTKVAGAAPAVLQAAKDLSQAETLDMKEALEAKAPVAPEIKAADLVPASKAEDEDTVHCDRCGDVMDDGEGYDGLCGNCADKKEAGNESSVIDIMSNDPQDTSLVEEESKGQEPKKLNQKEKAQALYGVMTSAMDKGLCSQAAGKLLAFKKSTRKSWTALGLPSLVQAEIEDAMGVQPAPVNEEKPKAKAKSKAASPAKNKAVSPQEWATQLLQAGKGNAEVAEITGLSKDQVYRLKKKLQS